jgi:FMN-dependent NADH-azoreductase
VSAALVTELKQADVVIIAVAIYNLNVPTALKAWIDMVRKSIFNHVI